jgi:hypothetical protein
MIGQPPRRNGSLFKGIRAAAHRASLDRARLTLSSAIITLRSAWTSHVSAFLRLRNAFLTLRNARASHVGALLKLRNALLTLRSARTSHVSAFLKLSSPLLTLRSARTTHVRAVVTVRRALVSLGNAFLKLTSARTWNVDAFLTLRTAFLRVTNATPRASRRALQWVVGPFNLDQRTWLNIQCRCSAMAWLVVFVMTWPVSVALSSDSASAVTNDVSYHSHGQRRP